MPKYKLHEHLAESVREALTQFPETRDCDISLVRVIWLREQTKLEYRPMGVSDVCKAMKRGHLSHFDSIARARRKLQQEDETLRGDKYIERVTKREQKVREEMRESWE